MWNPDGDGAWRLLGCRVTSAFYADGSAVPSDDPVLQMLIADSDRRAPAKMVDLDPQQHLASMLYGLVVRIADRDLSIKFNVDRSLARTLAHRYVERLHTKESDKSVHPGDESSLAARTRDRYRTSAHKAPCSSRPLRHRDWPGGLPSSLCGPPPSTGSREGDRFTGEDATMSTILAKNL